MRETGFSIRRTTPDDAATVGALMNRAFATDDATPTFNAAWWRWKYLANPAGYHGLVAENPEGDVVGHYGGVPIAMDVDGQAVQFGQNCDSCSDPSVRRGLRNPGLFVRLAQAYASTFAVTGEDAVMYGLPNRDVYRVGARYLDYWMLRQQLALIATGFDPSPCAEAITVSTVERFGPEIDALWARVAPAYRCVARRNAAFLNWRFADAPGRPYGLAVATDPDGARACAAWRSAELLGRRFAMIMDFVGDPGDDTANTALLLHVAEACRSLDTDAFFFICPTSSPWFARFQRWGFHAMPAPYMMTARPYDPRFEPAYLRAHWHYTLADFDIV